MSTEMFKAIINGDQKKVRAFLDAGHPIDQPVYEGGSALFHAVEDDKLAIVKLLIERGANVNLPATRDIYTALVQAAFNENLEILKALLAAGADPKQPEALMMAAGAKVTTSLAMVEELLRAGADPNADLLSDAGVPSRTVLMGAMDMENAAPAVVSRLIAAGAEVNAIRAFGSPLTTAINEGRADLVALLLRSGADATLRLPNTYPGANERVWAEDCAGKNGLDMAHAWASYSDDPAKTKKKIIAMLEDAIAGKLPPAPTPPPPKPPVVASTSDVPALWSRIEKALKKKKIKAQLRPAVSEGPLQKLEKKCKVALPDDVKASWQIHDGQRDGSDSLVPEGFTDEEYQLLSMKGMLAEWEPWKELLDSDEFADRPGEPAPGIRGDWYHAAWIPFASNGGGDSLCIDLAPAEGGIVGQVISVRHESGERTRVADSFAVFLAMLAEKWEETDELDD